MENCAFCNGEFINLYTKENPILNSGDICYGLIFNNDDFHRPIMIKGSIIIDKFVDGMNKQYYVKIIEILESPKAIKEFLIGKTVNVYPYSNEVLHTKRTIKINSCFNYNENLFKIEAYFVRNSEEKIKELRKEYINVIREDINRMLKDINEI